MRSLKPSTLPWCLPPDNCAGRACTSEPRPYLLRLVCRPKPTCTTQAPPGAVPNTTATVGDLSRLRNRAALDLFRQGELLEDPRLYQQGLTQQAGAVVNQLLRRDLASFAQFTTTYERSTSRSRPRLRSARATTERRGHLPAGRLDIAFKLH